MTSRPVFGALLLATTCQVADPNPQEYVVAYNLTASTGVTCDSVKYENALGEIVKVTSPTIPWGYAYSATPGTYLQAKAWITATASGQQAKLKATWTLTGVSSAADSSFGTTTAAGKFSLTVSRRRL
jgi:hypothetical protein